MSHDKAVSDVFDFQNDVPVRQWVSYILNSQYRTAVTLSPWLEQFVNEDVDAHRTALEAIRKDFPHDPSDYDSVVLSVLKWAVMRFKYVSDDKVWKLSERWQTPTESLALMTGDCEDGAILMYTLCRKLGVPANQLLLFCGNVWDGYGVNKGTESYIKQEDINILEDLRCQKDLKDFKKVTQYGNIQTVLRLVSPKDNDYLLIQSLKGVLNLLTKETSDQKPEVSVCGNLSKEETLFAIDVKRLIEENLQSITSIKIDLITLQKIWRYYVGLVTPLIMEKKAIPGSLVNVRQTNGVGGHCWLGYRPLDYPLNFVFLDWCYWSDTHSVLNRPLFYINDKSIVQYNIQDTSTYVSTNSNYYSIWFAFNENLSYLSFKRK